MKKTELFNGNMRRELRELLAGNGVDPLRANLVVDLACFAVERGVEAFHSVLKTAPDFGVGMMSTELALQLATDHFTQSSKAMTAIAAKLGMPQRSGSVNVGGEANG